MATLRKANATKPATRPTARKATKPTATKPTAPAPITGPTCPQCGNPAMPGHFFCSATCQQADYAARVNAGEIAAPATKPTATKPTAPAPAYRSVSGEAITLRNGIGMSESVARAFDSFVRFAEIKPGKHGNRPHKTLTMTGPDGAAIYFHAYPARIAK